MKQIHEYEELTVEKRPQDPGQDLKGWTFRSSEHGGEYPDSMPQVIVATDLNGRVCKYVPITEGGRVVDSKGFTLESSVVPPNSY